MFFIYVTYLPVSLPLLPSPFSPFPIYTPPILLLLSLLHTERGRHPMGLHKAWDNKVRQDQAPALTSTRVGRKSSMGKTLPKPTKHQGRDLVLKLTIVTHM